ncbi:imidazole glycerol phosphate synthase subunit HisH [Candidatus Bathyarchaeota archaeon]|nr:imidazole glycerol phosphate synthase subunit HisH [Candidatus Bathyarchaeota archaeon]
MPKVAVIDYGVGNLFSIKCSFKRAGLSVDLCSEDKRLKDADALVIPGVGNFKAGAENIEKIKVDLMDLIREGKPVLGICLGMQLLFEESDESPNVGGLNLLEGRVVRLPGNVKIPHMGWNTLKIVRSTVLLDGISEEDYFYFVHSYYVAPRRKNIVMAETEYGVRFTSVVMQNNIFGVQFHPEKSGKPGERIIGNFANLIRR